MAGCLLDKILGVSRETIDKLGEIAPIIFFALIWAFSIIAKLASAAKKGGGEGGQKDKGGKRKLDFNDLVRTVRQRYTEVKEQAKKATEQAQARLKSPAQAAVYRSGTNISRYPVGPQYKAATPEMRPDIQKLMVESPPQSMAQRQEENIAIPSHSYIAELTKQYSNVEGLRIALLHYEILGPPVGQRDI